MHILLLDNYDSFTYNLADHLFKAAPELPVTVCRNDQLTVEEAMRYDVFVLSPGPGLPVNAGIMPALLAAIDGQKPVLGICLGMQAIAEHYGGSLYNLPKVYHGLSRSVRVIDDNDGIYKGIPETFTAGRYHSWAVNTADLPDVLTGSAMDDDGVLMSLYHRKHPVHGLQYHPESIMTPSGVDLIANFIELCKTG